MYDDLDVNKARIFLYYLAKAAREEREVKEAEIVSAGDRIRSLARRLDTFIQLQEKKKFETLSKKDIKLMLEEDLARIKKLLIQAKQEGEDPEKLYSMVERASKLKEKIKSL